MLFSHKKQETVLFTVILLLMISGLVWAQEKITELKFAKPPVSDSDTSRTLKSLVKVQGTGQFCEDGLYLMTHFGDREELFQKENQKAIDNPLIDQTWRHRSMSETLEKTKRNVNWKAGMKILQDVTQKGTTWSVAYSLTSKELHFSVYQNWSAIYHLKAF